MRKFVNFEQRKHLGLSRNKLPSNLADEKKKDDDELDEFEKVIVSTMLYATATEICTFE